MEKITMLGTGAAMVTRCYNTCFMITDDADETAGAECMLVDGGGGNQILCQFEKLGRKASCVRNIFISHNHSDHILGVVWVVRAITQEINKGRYLGNLTVYAHPRSLEALKTICGFVMQPKLNKHFGDRVILHPISDGYEADIMGRHFQFFDIQSTKELQHGFVCTLHNGKRLGFCGDEPLQPCNEDILRGVDILMQEAYCSYEDVEVFNPYPKHHGTVKDSSENAERLGVKRQILFHTEGRTIDTRRQRYTAEAQAIFSGESIVPDDLEEIFLD